MSQNCIKYSNSPLSRFHKEFHSQKQKLSNTVDYFKLKRWKSCGIFSTAPKVTFIDDVVKRNRPIFPVYRCYKTRSNIKRSNSYFTNTRGFVFDAGVSVLEDSSSPQVMRQKKKVRNGTYSKARLSRLRFSVSKSKQWVPK